MSDDKPKPLPIGHEFDGHRIVDVLEYDPDDDYQPYLYQLSNGDTVWIPTDEA